MGFAFSQLSQQYHDETDAEFVQPGLLSEYPDALRVWADGIRSAKGSYRKILDLLVDMERKQVTFLNPQEVRRAIRSADRSILPNATETKIVVTANARALRYFLRVRGTVPGDLEARKVAVALLSAVSPDAPSLFSDFRIEQLPEGPVIR